MSQSIFLIDIKPLRNKVGLLRISAVRWRPFMKGIKKSRSSRCKSKTIDLKENVASQGPPCSEKLYRQFEDQPPCLIPSVLGKKEQTIL
jgi:hypothetical protein